MLDTSRSEALRHEGLARELVNLVQNLRKSSGLEVSQRIRLSIASPAGGEISATLANAELCALLCAETLTEEFKVAFSEGDHRAHKATDKIEDEDVVLSLEAIA